MKHERVNIKFHPEFSVPKSWKQLHELSDEIDIPQIGVKSYRVPPGQAKKIRDQLSLHTYVKDIEVDGDGEGIPFDGIGTSQVEWDSLLYGQEWFQEKVRAHDAWSELGEADWVSPKIGICDSGLKQNHPWIVDQCTIGGQQNFVALESTVNDNEGHGTACAGLICSTMPYFTLYNARVMSQNSAKWSALSQGIIWCVDQGCKVVSVSIGGPSNSFSLIDAILYAYNKGVSVLVAAGNAGNDTPQYPSATKNAVAISATDGNDNKCGFSSYGSHIQLAAPGDSLLTAWGDGFSRFSGTSGSTPIAAAVVAMAAVKWNINGVQAVEKVKATAKNLNNPLYFGAGRVDAAAAVGLPAESAPPPAPPPSEPPPPEQPPSDGTWSDVTSSASVSASLPAFESAGEGLGNLNDNTNRKALWFNRDVTVTYKFPKPVVLKYSVDRSANDYPTRDPRTINWNGEVQQTSWANRFEDRKHYFNAGNIASDTWVCRMIAGTEYSPGDKGNGILQLAEQRLFGFYPAITQPPPEPPPPEPELPINVLAALSELDTFISGAVAAEKDLLRTELLSLTNKLG